MYIRNYMCIDVFVYSYWSGSLERDVLQRCFFNGLGWINPVPAGRYPSLLPWILWITAKQPLDLFVIRDFWKVLQFRTVARFQPQMGSLALRSLACSQQQNSSRIFRIAESLLLEQSC